VFSASSHRCVHRVTPRAVRQHAGVFAARTRAAAPDGTRAGPDLACTNCSSPTQRPSPFRLSHHTCLTATLDHSASSDANSWRARCLTFCMGRGAYTSPYP
jgi:hypothetical protein